MLLLLLVWFGLCCVYLRQNFWLTFFYGILHSTSFFFYVKWSIMNYQLVTLMACLLILHWVLRSISFFSGIIKIHGFNVTCLLGIWWLLLLYSVHITKPRNVNYELFEWQHRFAFQIYTMDDSIMTSTWQMIGWNGNIDIIAIHPKKENINRMYGCVCARVLKQLNNDVDNNYDAFTAGFFSFVCLMESKMDWNDFYALPLNLYYTIYYMPYHSIRLHIITYRVISQFTFFDHQNGLSVWFECEFCL